MVKVGDNLIVTGKTGHFIPVGSKVTVVEVNNGPTDRDCRVESEIGLRQWVCNDDLRKFSPPEKIQQNGYEYSLVGPVKPEWLVDGAWVVRKDNGCKHQVVLNKNGLLVLTMPGTDTTILPTHHIYDQYRPHEPKDWKWGDWAMYYGKRVFVMSRMNHDCLVGISFPNIDGEDLTDPMRQWDFAEEHELTPTF